MATESQATQKKEALALYNKGENIYKIAREVFGFDSDDAVEQTKRLLGLEELL
jgi:hypothetical protein